MDITGIIIAIAILGLIVSPGKSLKTMSGIGLPNWAKKMKSSTKWMINGKEIFAKARVLKWALLALLKLALLTMSFFTSLLKVAISSATRMLPSVVKK